MLSGLAAFVYVAALWSIAPAFLSSEEAPVADRLRAVIAIGVALPGVLGLLHLLYAPLVWLGVAGLILWGIRERALHFAVPDFGLSAAFAGIMLVVWPPLSRPLLDGDTLLYHLPNAVSFVQSHSVWTARAPYWVYPPGSELFAAGLFAVSGRWALPLAGILPALMLTARLYAVARANGASPFAAASVPLAFMCMPVAAFQAGTLQNDLWLCAFFVEVLAGRGVLSFAVCALIKPYGWLEALIAAAAARMPWRSIAVGLSPLAVWVVRDAILVAAGASLGFSSPAYWITTIAGNFNRAVPQLAGGIAAVTPQAFIWIAMLLAGLVIPRTRRYAIAGAVALALYAFLPVSYSDGASTNFVTDASSLRYALPALAAGALVASLLIARIPVWGAIGAYAIAFWGAFDVLAVYWNDGYAHYAFAAAALVLVATLVPRPVRMPAVALTALLIVLASSWSASSRAQGFYADWMRGPSGKPTGVFAWIARHSPQRVVATNVRIGAILMSSPGTWALSSEPASMCGAARRERALLLVGSNEGLRGRQLDNAVAIARSCGSVVYADSAAVVVQAP